MCYMFFVSFYSETQFLLSKKSVLKFNLQLIQAVSTSYNHIAYDSKEPVSQSHSWDLPKLCDLPCKSFF